MAQSSVRLPPATPLTRGKELEVLNDTLDSAGVIEQTFTLDADTVLFMVQATVVSGTLDIEVFTEIADGQSVSVMKFDQLTAPTTSLVKKEPTDSQVLQRIRVVATVTGEATFRCRARGLARGQALVQVQGNGSWDATQTTISTTATLLIPAALSDRSGMVVLNNNLSSGKMYIGPTAAKAVTTNGYPIGPQQAIALDLDAGAEVYALSDSTDIDVRILEAGL